MAQDWSGTSKNSSPHSHGQAPDEAFDPSTLSTEQKEIYDLMQTDREAALKKVREYYGNEDLGINDNVNVRYEPSLGAEGHVNKNGIILIGNDAFSRGPQWLGSIIRHESVHYKQMWWGDNGNPDYAAAYEAAAYKTQMNSMRTFGLSMSEYTAIFNRQQFYCARIPNGISDGGTGC